MTVSGLGSSLREMMLLQYVVYWYLQGLGSQSGPALECEFECMTLMAIGVGKRNKRDI